MNELLKNLTEQLKSSSAGSKLIALLVGVAMVGAIGLTAVVSNRPHFEIAFSSLSDHEVARVNKALSETGIAFEVSQPPGPFSVFVDRADRSAAYRAAYGAGALDKPLKGILSEAGVSSVFQGTEERMQGVRKREWEEMEGMLEELDFVLSARVRTSPGTSSPFAGKRGEPISASVTLRLTIPHLSAAQSDTVATLVSRGLGIDEANLVISDQSGNGIFGGQTIDELDQEVAELMAQRIDYDRRATEEANAVLREILGPDKARVTVRSEWDYDRSTVRTEMPQGKGTLLSESKTKSETPVGTGSVGGPAGLSANVVTEDDADRADSAALAGPVEPPMATESEETKQYQPSLRTEERVRFVPELDRLSIAVFLDQSLEDELAATLESTIKASVGYVEGRDEFSAVRLPFVAGSVEEGESSTEEAAPAEPAEPNPMLEMLFERGVEIVTALVFVVLLLKSLKGAGKSAPKAENKGAGAAEDSVDPELLARAQIDELLQSNPERVGEILSSWVRSEKQTAAS